MNFNTSNINASGANTNVNDKKVTSNGSGIDKTDVTSGTTQVILTFYLFI